MIHYIIFDYKVIRKSGEEFQSEIFFTKNYNGRIRNIKKAQNIQSGDKIIFNVIEKLKIHSDSDIKIVLDRIDFLRTQTLEEVEITMESDTQIIQMFSDNQLEEEFNSIEDASNYTNISIDKIKKVLKGEQKTTGGFSFVYKK